MCNNATVQFRSEMKDEINRFGVSTDNECGGRNDMYRHIACDMCSTDTFFVQFSSLLFSTTFSNCYDYTDLILIVYASNRFKCTLDRCASC